MAHYIAVAKEIGTIMVFYVLHKSCEPVARSSLPQFCHNKAFFPDGWERIKKKIGKCFGKFLRQTRWFCWRMKSGFPCSPNDFEGCILGVLGIYFIRTHSYRPWRFLLECCVKHCRCQVCCSDVDVDVATFLSVCHAIKNTIK